MIVDQLTDSIIINDGLNFLYDNGKCGYAPMKGVIKQIHPEISDDQAIAYCQFLYVHEWITFPQYLDNIEGKIVYLFNEQVNNGLTNKAKKILIQHNNYLTYLKSQKKLLMKGAVIRWFKNAAAILAPLAAVLSVALGILQILDTQKIEAIQQKQQTMSTELGTLKQQLHSLLQPKDTSKSKIHPIQLPSKKK